MRRGIGEGLVAVNTYQVDVERDGKYWLVRVPEVRRSTQARRLSEIDEMARDLIAIMTNADPKSFALQVSIKLPSSVARHLEKSKKLRERAAQAQAEAAAEVRVAARELHDTGLPVREIGEVLGVSHQRAHQLISA